MQWSADVSAGDWIRDRLDPDDASWGSTMHGVVPRGFDAYARVFHPALRDRPVGEPWPPLPYDRHAREWEQFQARSPEIDAEHVSWRESAAAFGRELHALAQWQSIAVDPGRPQGEDGPRDAAGWRYGDPPLGSLDAALLAQVLSHAATRTTTPDDVWIALWEGHAGVVGSMGFGPSRVLLTADDGDRRHDDFLAHSVRDTFNDVFRRPSWRPGILSDEISRGTRLELPHRAHVLFHGAVDELVDPAWPLHAPWRDPEIEAEHAAMFIESPSLVWPADHAWVLVTEVDYDSTIVGGSEGLIRALCTDPAIEALPVREGADLGAFGDTVDPADGAGA